MTTMIEIKGYPGYYLADDDKSIIGKWHREMKTYNNCVKLFRDGKGKVIPVNKLIWCAKKGVSPDDIPKGYSFRWFNGDIMAETFSDRMSYVKRKSSPHVKMDSEQINYHKNYFEILEEVFNNVEGAQAKLFALINDDKEAFIKYACKLQNSKEKAEVLVDSAIMATMEVICDDNTMVSNPRGCVKSYIRGLVRENKRIMFTDEKELDKFVKDN